MYQEGGKPGSLNGLELLRQARLAGWLAPGMALPLNPALGSQACPITLGFFTWHPGSRLSFSRLHGKSPGVSTWIFETGAHCIAQVDFELMTLLLPTPEFHEYRSELPCLSPDPNRGL